MPLIIKKKKRLQHQNMTRIAVTENKKMRKMGIKNEKKKNGNKKNGNKKLRI